MREVKGSGVLSKHRGDVALITDRSKIAFITYINQDSTGVKVSRKQNNVEGR